MTKLAPEWVRTTDPVIRSPARYRWTTRPPAIHEGESYLSVRIYNLQEARSKKYEAAQNVKSQSMCMYQGLQLRKKLMLSTRSVQSWTIPIYQSQLENYLICLSVRTQNIPPRNVSRENVRTAEWAEFPRGTSHSDTYVNKKGVKKQGKVWKQVKKSCSVPQLVEALRTSIKDHSNHVFRASYQQRVESSLMEDLPMNHAVAVMDFSENITLQAQDEIERAHWNNKQVTLHPTYLV